MNYLLCIPMTLACAILATVLWAMGDNSWAKEYQLAAHPFDSPLWKRHENEPEPVDDFGPDLSDLETDWPHCVGLGLGAGTVLDRGRDYDFGVDPNACIRTDGRVADQREILSLLDGAYEIVEIWKATSPSQIEWKKKWLKRVDELCPQL